MAKRHVIEYYKQVQDLYFDMVQDTVDFDEALQAGHVSQEQVDQANEMLQRVKDNYDRLSYIIVLLNQPNKKKKLKKHKNQHKEVYSFLDSVSEETTLKEIQDDLKQFKEYIKQEKEKLWP